MIYAPKPTCHHVPEAFVIGHDLTWRDPEMTDKHGHPRCFRTCSYCGSIHPEDLVELLRNGARMHGSDWKYGYPHKFYIENIPNPMAGQECVVMTEYRSIDGKPLEPVETLGPAGETVGGKFYSEHVLDDGMDAEARELLTNALYVHTGIRFRKTDDGRLQYAAPYHGYQR